MRNTRKIRIHARYACITGYAVMKIRDNGRAMNSARATEPALPSADRRTASAPRPSSRRRCPGRTASAVSSLGAPRKIAGIISWSV